MISVILILLLAETTIQLCLCQVITRGDSDEIRFHTTVDSGMMDNVRCYEHQVCKCNYSSKTLIFNSRMLSARCVTDQDILKQDRDWNHPTKLVLVKPCDKTEQCMDRFIKVIYPWNCRIIKAVNSSYSADGSDWYILDKIEKNIKIESLGIRIKGNEKSLFQNFQGTLLRLAMLITCNYPLHNLYGTRGIILKIAGSTTLKKPPEPASKPTAPTSMFSSSTLSATASSRESSTKSNTSTESSTKFSINTTVEFIASEQLSTVPLDPGKNNKKDSDQGKNSDKDSDAMIPIVAAVVVLFGLLIVLIGVVLFFRWRKRSLPKQDDYHLYEENTPSSTPGKSSLPSNEVQNFSNNYRTAEAYISETSNKANSKRPRNDNKTTYDYATREETVPSVPSLNTENISNGIYHEIESMSPAIVPATGDIGNGKNKAGQVLSDSNVYHTLENSNGIKQYNDGVYEALEDGQSSEPVYFELEGRK